jgi:hypothetical protein
MVLILGWSLMASANILIPEKSSPPETEVTAESLSSVSLALTSMLLERSSSVTLVLCLSSAATSSTSIGHM